MAARTASPTKKRRVAPARRAAPRAPRRNARSGEHAKTQARLLSWFAEHGRHFPWRETRDPYRTMVAEVMLQQTQTGRVAPSYHDFLERFPTVDRLAHAPAMEVIQAWRGLGYNRRAVDLQRAAQAVAADHGGEFPREVVALRRLPGLGEYSSNAIACFAFDAQVPVVDTNVRRVLSRAALGRNADDVPAERVAITAKEWLPPGEAYRWNQALMDVGAMLCRVSTPLCAKCPLRNSCVYRAEGRDKATRPRPRKKGEPFEGSRRQQRGTIVDHLRRAARTGISVSELASLMHPNGAGRDLDWLVEILVKLEGEGLADLTPGARKGSPRGLVRLPG